MQRLDIHHDLRRSQQPPSLPQPRTRPEQQPAQASRDLSPATTDDRHHHQGGQADSSQTATQLESALRASHEQVWYLKVYCSTDILAKSCYCQCVFRYVTFFRSHTSIVVALLSARTNILLAWQDGCHTEDLLCPVCMGCATKNAKVITIALGSLQRLISLHAVPLSAVPAIIQTMNDCISQGVDIQLKILQTLLSLITNFSAVHSRLLANVRT